MSSEVLMSEGASSTVSSGVTLETLSEDGVLPPIMTSAAASSANGGHHPPNHVIHHPLLTPTSPRSVTTASMSASGKPKIIFLYCNLCVLRINYRKIFRVSWQHLQRVHNSGLKEYVP